MENPVLQLSCETKQAGGLTIHHENCNTNNVVSSSIVLFIIGMPVLIEGVTSVII